MSTSEPSDEPGAHARPAPGALPARLGDLALSADQRAGERTGLRAGAGMGGGAGIAMLRRFFLLAWRMLVSHRMRTGLNLAALVFGQAVMILTFGIARGTQDSLIDQVCRGATGHLQVQAPDYHETERLKSYMPRAVPLATLRAACPLVREVRERVRVVGALEVDEQKESQIVAGWGIDPAREIPPAIVAGKPLPPVPVSAFPPYPILIGKQAAVVMNLSPGSLVILNFLNVEGKFDSVQCRIQGIVDEGSPDRNRLALAIHIATARRMLGIGDGLHEELIILGSPDEVDQADAMLSGIAGPSARVLPWQELDPQLRRVTRVIHSQAVLLVFVVVVVVLFGIGNATATSGTERVREFGLLAILGFTPSQIFLSVVSEGILIGIVSFMGAAALSFLGLVVLRSTGLDLTPFAGEAIILDGVRIDMTLRPVLSASYFAMAAGLVGATALAASLLPAWRATRIKPAQALRLDG